MEMKNVICRYCLESFEVPDTEVDVPLYVCKECTKKANKNLKDNNEPEVNDEYRECVDCIHNRTVSPCPCDSCEQNTPTNLTHFKDVSLMSALNEKTGVLTGKITERAENGDIIRLI